MIYNKETIIGHELEAVKEDGFNIIYIENPSEEVQLEALKHGDWVTQYIKNLSPFIINSSKNIYSETIDENKFKIRLSGIAYESLVNGPGMRRVLFAQGCTHNCKGCFNPDTHDLNGGELKDVDEIVKDILQNPIIKGVTFSGGDPFEQAERFAYIARELKMVKNLNIWCYTGYLIEKLIENKEQRNSWGELLNNIDVLVDGKFDETKKGEFRYRGSSNQRIIDVKKTLETGEIEILKYD